MQLSGPQKAALLLLSLKEEQATPVLQHLTKDELRAIGTAVEDIENVKSDTFDGVYRDFVDAYRAGLTTVRGGGHYLKNLVRKSHGEAEALRLFSGATGSDSGDSDKPLNCLTGVDPQVLGVVLAGEHPQVAAALLAHVDAGTAALVIEQMPVDKQAGLLQRISRLQTVPPAAIAIADRALGGLALQPTSGGTIDGITVAASILNHMTGGGAEEVLERLTEVAPRDAVSVKRAMFTFENLVEVDQRGLQQLMREIQSDTLRLALKTASEDLKAKFFACISSRAAEILQEEMELMPATPLSEVETAQMEIVETAMRMAGEGRLRLGRGGEEMV